MLNALKALPLAAKWIGAAVLLVVVLLILRSVGGWLNDPTGSKAVQGKFDRAGSIIGGAGKAASDKAAAEASAQAEREAASRDLARSNGDEITGQKDSGVGAGDTGRAGLVGLCRRDSFRNDPRNRQLCGPHPAPAPRPR